MPSLGALPIRCKSQVVLASMMPCKACCTDAVQSHRTDEHVSHSVHQSHRGGQWSSDILRMAQSLVMLAAIFLQAADILKPVVSGSVQNACQCCFSRSIVFHSACLTAAAEKSALPDILFSLAQMEVCTFSTWQKNSRQTFGLICNDIHLQSVLIHAIYSIRKSVD